MAPVLSLSLSADNRRSSLNHNDRNLIRQSLDLSGLALVLPNVLGEIDGWFGRCIVSMSLTVSS